MISKETVEQPSEGPEEAWQRLHLQRQKLGSQRKLAERKMQSVRDRYLNHYYSLEGYTDRILRAIGLSFLAEKRIPLETTKKDHDEVVGAIEKVENEIASKRFLSPRFPSPAVKEGGGFITGNTALEVVEVTQSVKSNGKEEESLMPDAVGILPEEGGDIRNWWSWPEFFGKKLKELATSEQSTRDTKQRVVVGVTREGIREVVGKKIREKDLDRLIHAINQFEAGSAPKRILENVGGLWEVQAGDYRIILNPLGGKSFSLEDIGPREGIFKSHRISPKRFS